MRAWPTVLTATLLAALLAGPCAAGPGDALRTYVAQPDPALAWTSRVEGRVGAARFRELLLTSQVWQGTPWRHQLVVICPDNARPGRPGVLFMAGGNWRDRYLERPGRVEAPAGTDRYVRIARRLEAPLAVLLQVPFQPLAGGLTEDALVAWSFEQFFAGAGDSSPLLLPMAKAGSAALTATTAVAAHDCGVAPQRFVVTGASKRAWAAWLLGAADPRVAGLVPAMFDAVWMDRQAAHQAATWGNLSTLLKRYRPLAERLGTPAGDELLAIVDPWRHRTQLAQPKLVVLGSNDPYWPPDSASLYLAGVGPASVLYLPNNDHVPDDVRRLADGLVALADVAADGSALPAVALQVAVAGDDVEVIVTADAPGRRARIWVARSDNAGFRYEPYVARRARRQGVGRYAATVPLDGGYVALFGEVDFAGRRGRYRLSSPLRIVGPGGLLPLTPPPGAPAGAD
jgi:PhoPQ-activated pathogenicity-related protein